MDRSAAVEFRVLGAVELRSGGVPVPLRGIRTQALFAALTLHLDRVVSTGELIDMVWGDTPPKTAPNQLQIAVHRLRTALSAAGLDAPRVLRTERNGYALRPPADRVTVDHRSFTDLSATAAGHAARGDWPRARAAVREALGRWRGPVAEGVTAERLRHLADSIDEDRLATTELLLTAELALSDGASAVPGLKRLVAAHPYRQRFWYLLVLALAERGRTAEALGELRTVRARLRADLGVDPDADLAGLERVVLRGDLDTAAATARAWYARDHGAAPAHPADAVNIPWQLPAEVPGFVGRDAELDRIGRLLSANTTDGHPAVIAVAGIGGIGKTSLVLRAAHQFRKYFPDGCLFADLRGDGTAPRDAHAVIGSFLHALGVGAEDVPADRDARLGVYRSVTARMRLLVVCDNAADEAQVRDLLPVHPSSAALVTGRRLLSGLDGAHIIELGVLSRPEAARLLVDIHRRRGQRLDATTAGRLADLTGRFPLALRIVASRTARRTPAGLERLMERLADEEHRLDELADGDREVRAGLAAAYGGLGEPAARLLRLLSLLPTTRFGADLAAALLGLPPAAAERALDGLVDAQLLGTAEAAAGVRYTLHPLVRLYARERAAHDPLTERTAAMRRAYVLLIALTRVADEALGTRRYPTPARTYEARDPAAAERVRADPLTWFTAELPLITDVVHQGIALGYPRLAWHLVTSLVNYLDLIAFPNGGLLLVNAALDAAEPDDETRAGLLLAQAIAYGTVTRHHEAWRAASLARRLFLRRGDRVRAAAAAIQVGEALRSLTRPALAATAARWALATLAGENPSDPAVAAQTGWAHRELAGPDGHREPGEPAADTLHRAVEAFRDAGDRCGEGRSLTALAASHADGAEVEGLALAERAVEILTAVGDRAGGAQARVVLAGHLVRAGRSEEAYELAVSAVEDVRELRHPMRTLDALRGLIGVLLPLGRPQEAMPALHEALALLHARDLPGATAQTLCDLADAHLALGEPGPARAAVAEARRYFGLAGLPPTRAETVEARLNAT